MRYLPVALPSALLLLSAAPALGQQPNIVVLLADDVGRDFVGAYGVGNLVPCTPNIDAIADEGLLFRNAWTNPTCSPTRASLLTGRYALRHGIGITLLTTEPGLALHEQTIPEMLLGYDSAAFGKWHLHGDLGSTHPNDTGFGTYAGNIDGQVPSYFDWPKTTNGVVANTTTYAVTDTVNDAVDALATLQEPFFMYVSFNAIHSPFHVPPSSLCSSAGCETSFCANLPAEPGLFGQSRAMMEALDLEVGRFMTELEARDPSAYVIFMGDNGTFGPLSTPPFVQTHAKGTMYEGGVGVPLIVKGPGVAVGETNGLVSSTDLFATLAELANIQATATDSVSFVPYFTDPLQPSLRETVYSERFFPNHGWPKQTHQQALRDTRYKLIRIKGQPEQFFDLQEDPFETLNLLPNLTMPQRDAYNGLIADLGQLMTAAPVTYCTSGTSASGCQATISSVGTPSASSPFGFELQAVQVEGQSQGIFFFGSNGRQAVPWTGSTSFQCVVPKVKRTGLMTGVGALGTCEGWFKRDLAAIWCSTCPQPGKNPGAGATVQAQLWYRDPLNTSGLTTSLSDALEFVLEP